MPWIRVSACWLVGSVRWLSRYVIPFVQFVQIQSFHSFSILDSVVVVFIRRRRRLYCCFFYSALYCHPFILAFNSVAFFNFRRHMSVVLRSVDIDEDDNNNGSNDSSSNSNNYCQYYDYKSVRAESLLCVVVVLFSYVPYRWCMVCRWFVLKLSFSRSANANRKRNRNRNVRSKNPNWLKIANAIFIIQLPRFVRQHQQQQREKNTSSPNWFSFCLYVWLHCDNNNNI